MLETKACCTCKKELSIECFNFKNKEKNIYQSECKSCHKNYNHKWYLKNSNYLIDKAKYKIAVLTAWLANYKSSLFCEKCGENHVATLDFHHRNPTEKEYTITVMIRRGFTIKKVLNEISKCDVLCSNCHRKLHYNKEGV
jgi:hypothetical protein